MIVRVIIDKVSSVKVGNKGEPDRSRPCETAKMFGNLCKLLILVLEWGRKNEKCTLLMDRTVRISHRLRIVRRTSSELSGRDSVQLLLKGRARERRLSLLNLKAVFILPLVVYPVLKRVRLDNVDMSTNLQAS